MKYLSWQETTITDFTEKAVTDMYVRGFVFTRIARGVMQQTRAVRIDLSKFELSSENRRILKKIGDIQLSEISLPLVPADYHWSTAKLAKDFYENKFGAGIMSAAKIKEMLTDSTKSNFNTLLTFSGVQSAEKKPVQLGFAICYKNADLLHYSYPFYDLGEAAGLPKDIGLGMMILAIEHAKKARINYVYLGSLQRPGDTYKLQFKGLEWFDGGPEGSGEWLTDIEKAKTVLK